MENYDFAMGWAADKEESELFVSALKSECEAKGLKFIFVDETALNSLNKKIKIGRFKLKFYLDMASETFDPKDKFMKLAYSLKDSGTRVVADPDNVKVAADKSITHFDLANAGIPVPFTILIRNWEQAVSLTDKEKLSLGVPFVIKPALGYGENGVKIFREKFNLKEIADARKSSKNDNFLLQEFIDPAEFDGQPAWFRVFYLFGETFPCWWNPHTHVYRRVTTRDADEYKLLPIVRITMEIARITRIDWFSCEIALSRKNRKFFAIDYMNDQCSINPQSRSKKGVPDELVIQLAERMVAKVFDDIRGRFTLSYRAIWFPKVKIKDENV